MTDKVRTSIEIYMNDIGKIPLVTKEEEVELAALIAQGSQEAFDKLVEANLRLVVKIAHDYKKHGQLEDIVSAGNKGLMRAAEKFDPHKGSKFSSYAAWWIKQSIRRTTSEDKIISIPIASLVKIRKVKNGDRELEFSLGRPPTNKELAKHIGFNESLVRKYRNEKIDTVPISLSEPLDNNGDGRVGDLIPNENDIAPLEIIINEEYYQHLYKALDKLDKRSRFIIINRYGLKGRVPKTLEVVSEKIGKTRERVRQIQNDALYKIRRELRLMDKK